MAIKGQPAETQASAASSAADVWATFNPTADARGPIRANPTAPFLLRYRSDLWELATEGLEQPELLPVVTAHVMQAGIGGVHQVGREYPTWEKAGEDAITKAMRNGWRYLPHTEPIDRAYLPVGAESGPYLRKTPCIHPIKGDQGTHHHEAWVTFEPQLDDKPHRARWHMGLRNRWLLSLRDRGVFGIPTADVIARIAKEAGVSIDYIRGSALITPEVRAEALESRRSNVERVEAAGRRALGKPAVAAEATNA